MESIQETAAPAVTVQRGAVQAGDACARCKDAGDGEDGAGAGAGSQETARGAQRTPVADILNGGITKWHSRDSAPAAAAQGREDGDWAGRSDPGSVVSVPESRLEAWAAARAARRAGDAEQVGRAASARQDRVNALQVTR